MAKYKCKMCGAPLNVSEGQTVITCEFCQSKQTVANANDERKENLFNRANSLRAMCDFDKAILAYQSILSIFPNEPEAHFGICLCKYGIEYVDDPTTHKKIPTIHRVSYDSILRDPDYLSALAYSDVIAKEEYQEEAKEIANIQKNILSISQKEAPFDIFICYKETDEDGKRTKDSVLAQEIYTNLIDKGYKVFFSRITLESKLGTMYEPYIFAALNSAKIMLVIGTNKNYFEAVWVRNEWSRFIDLMKTRPDHYLIPCYKDMNAYDMPEEFLSFQGQDMNKLGFMQDLLRGIDKIMGRVETPKSQTEPKIIQTDVNILSLLKRAEILISDGNFTKADDVLERVLDNDPTNSQAYLYKLLIELKLNNEEQLTTLDETIVSNYNFKKAYNFGNKEQKQKLDLIIETIKNKKLEALYKKALVLKEDKHYYEAINAFELINDYKDSKEQIEDCRNLINKGQYDLAIDLKNKRSYNEAIRIFNTILSYQDSEYQIDECRRLKEEQIKEEIYQMCLLDKEIKSKRDLQLFMTTCHNLEIISGYKDANDLLAKYKTLISDYEIECAKRSEELERQRAKRIKKIKKISFIATLSSIVLTGILLLIFLLIVPSARNSRIHKLIDEAKYDEASKLIEKNNDYRGYNKLLILCKAGISFESNDYEAGIKYICSIGGEVKINFDADGGTQDISHEIINDSKSVIDNLAYKEEYDFKGWSIVNYNIDIESFSASINLKAQYEIVLYKITYSLNGGRAANLPSVYNFESSINLPNPTRDGYTFVGWIGTDLVEPVVDYIIPKGSTGNKSYVAKWNVNTNTPYKVEHYLENLNGEYDLHEIDNLTGTTNTLTSGFVNTYYGYISPSIHQETINGNGETVIELYYARCTYTILLNKNVDNVDTITGAGTYKFGEEVTINVKTKSNAYIFDGWYNGDSLVSRQNTYTFNMPPTNLTYTAKYTPKKYVITIDNQAEGVLITGIKSGNLYEYGSQITLSATNIPEGYTIKWVRSDGVEYNGDSYSFKVPARYLSITTTATLPYAREENKIYFGTYPQTLVTDNELINELNAAAGSKPTSSNKYEWIDYNYYISSNIICYMYYQDIDYDNDGLFDYRGVYFTRYRPYYYQDGSSISTTYQDDNGYSTNTIYWFSYDPIEWDILTESNGKALIIANLVLDSQEYYPLNSTSKFTHNGASGYTNNYELSDIRKFLNDNFYNTAFNSLQKSIIETTLVDNSLSSTGGSSNNYVCNNTNDKLFLLSVSEATTYYTSRASRQANGTDYAKAQGLYVYSGNSYWLLRSPSDYYAYYAYCVSYGDISISHVAGTSNGVRPACWINLK